MGLSIADAYSQIKNLENSGQINLPETQETVVIGTIDPKAGTFTWSVPTVTQTTVIPPGPGQKTNTIINVTVGVVSTKAVDLLLQFAVIPQSIVLVNHQVAAAEVVSGSPGGAAPAGGAAAVAAVGAARALEKLPAGAALSGAGAGAALTTETNGGTTISGFPTVSSAANQITVDAGFVCSQASDTPSVTPPVSRIDVTIQIPGHDDIDVPLFILRPPVVGMGAFTVPALPMTIVYAPPQGKQSKNTASYSDTQTFSRTVTSAVTSDNNTKTLQAYSAADLIGKVSSAITAVVAVVGSGGAAAAGGASVAGAFSELGQALFGPAQDANDNTANATQQITSELSLVSNILNAVGTTQSTDQGDVKTEDDQSLTISVATMDTFGAKPGLGPGVGDCIVYLSNVKVVWMAVNGEVGIYVLGFDGIGQNPVQDLQEEEQWLNGGGQPRLGLDLATIKSLLSQDPLVVAPQRITMPTVGPPLIGPPRFVPADPAERSGSGTGPMGYTFKVTLDTTQETKDITTSTQTNITDAKPGWVSVLFGADDNTETVTTTTFTTSQTTDVKSDDNISCTLTFFSDGPDDPYDVKIFHDRMFGTYLALDANSPALVGTTLVNKPVA